MNDYSRNNKKIIPLFYQHSSPVLLGLIHGHSIQSVVQARNLGVMLHASLSLPILMHQQDLIFNSKTFPQGTPFFAAQVMLKSPHCSPSHQEQNPLFLSKTARSLVLLTSSLPQLPPSEISRSSLCYALSSSCPLRAFNWLIPPPRMTLFLISP